MDQGRDGRSTGPVFEPTGQQAGRPAADPPAGDGSSGSSRRWWVIGGVALAVVAAVIVFVLLSRPEPEPLEPEVVVLPSPTSTVEPVDRGEASAFLAAMPDTVLEYGLTEFAEHEPLRTAGALEGWRLVYGDGGDGQVVVHAGQWRDAEGATQAMADLLAMDAEGDPAADDAAADDPAAEDAAAGDAAADPAEPGAGPTAGATDEDARTALPQTGTVEVGGEAVGEYTIRETGDGEVVAVWTNGTALLQAQGPAAAFPNFYAAFPL